MDHWKAAKEEAHQQFLENSHSIPNYSYQDAAAAQRTGSIICEFMISNLSASKKLLFSISDLLFSLQLADKLLDNIHDIRDEIDLLSDTIRIYHCEWKGMPYEFLVRVMHHDNDLIMKSRHLVIESEALLNFILAEVKRHRRGRYMILAGFWEDVAKSMKGIHVTVKQLSILFREREALIGIRSLAMEKAYSDYQKGVRDGF